MFFFFFWNRCFILSCITWLHTYHTVFSICLVFHISLLKNSFHVFCSFFCFASVLFSLLPQMRMPTPCLALSSGARIQTCWDDNKQYIWQKKNGAFGEQMEMQVEANRWKIILYMCRKLCVERPMWQLKGWAGLEYKQASWQLLPRTDWDCQRKHIQDQKDKSYQAEPRPWKDDKTARQIQRLEQNTKSDWGQNEGTHAFRWHKWTKLTVTKYRYRANPGD